MLSLRRHVRRVATAAVLTAVIAATIVVAVAGGGSGTRAYAAADVTITARDFFWTPSTVTVDVGDTVTWTNTEGFHNVLLGDSRLNQPGNPSDPAWNPPPRVTFDDPGSYTFVCEVHPGMTGTVNVSGGGSPTPTPTTTPTPGPAVPPPTGGSADSTPPAISGLTVSGSGNTARVRLTVSERSTINARFVTSDDSSLLRSQVEAGSWTLERTLATGRWTYEIWATDAKGNRSPAQVGEVRIGG
jgi:plastocyanin